MPHLFNHPKTSNAMNATLTPIGSVRFCIGSAMNQEFNTLPAYAADCTLSVGYNKDDRDAAEYFMASLPSSVKANITSVGGLDNGQGGYTFEYIVQCWQKRLNEQMGIANETGNKRTARFYRAMQELATKKAAK
jgi:hypothetical protein